MEYITTEIEGLWIIEPVVIKDERGYFMESYKQSEFEQKIGKTDFIQDNESQSSGGVFRGFHFQEGEAAQAKLIRAIQGKVWDIAVDIRKASPTFGKYVAIELSEENKRQFFIPRGFAHGFLVLSETAVFSYKVDNIYSPAHERVIHCMDPDLAIQWPVERSQMRMSEKDRSGKRLRDI